MSEIPKLDAVSNIESVLELVPDAMVVVDGEGRIRAMNSQVVELLEYTRGELLGQPVEVLLPARFAASHPQRRNSFAEKPRTRAMGSGMELAARAKSGREIPVEISLRPVESGEGPLVCAAIRDVSERHKVEEAARAAEQQLRFIVENSPDFALIQDIDLRYRWVGNPPAPFTPADYLGKTDQERVALGHMSQAEADKLTDMRRQVIASGTTKHWEIETLLEGQKRYFEIVCGPLIDSNGKIAGLANYIRDRTEQTLILQALEAARTTAEQASARNARFLAIASHDLRQPIQALTMLLAAARMSSGRTGPSDLWQRIDETMRSQSEMLDSLLNMTKIESGNVALQIEVAPLSDLLRPVQMEMSVIAGQRGLTLNVTCPQVAISTDAMLFRQIIRNLIGNAIKYTDRGGVRVDCAEQGDRVLISVSDSGIGIPESALANVFGEFQQFRDDEGRTRGGVGLGLWIVRRLADQLGIQIHVRSRLGQGSTFTLDMKRAMRPHAGSEVAGAMETPARSASHRVLVVDDDETVRFATTVFLKMQGFEVVGAATLTEARGAIVGNPERFDLIISDFHLVNDEFGVDAIKFARSYYEGVLPAIVVSGDTSKAVGEFKSWEHTVFLNKPVDADHLLQTISELLPTA